MHAGRESLICRFKGKHASGGSPATHVDRMTEKGANTCDAGQALPGMTEHKGCSRGVIAFLLVVSEPPWSDHQVHSESLEGRDGRELV